RDAVRSSWRLQADVEAGGHGAERGQLLLERASPGGGDTVIPFGAATPFGGGFAELARHEALGLEARQRLIDGAQCEVPPGFPADGGLDDDAVRVIGRLHHGHYYELPQTT